MESILHKSKLLGVNVEYELLFKYDMSVYIVGRREEGVNI